MVVHIQLSTTADNLPDEDPYPTTPFPRRKGPGAIIVRPGSHSQFPGPSPLAGRLHACQGTAAGRQRSCIVSLSRIKSRLILLFYASYFNLGAACDDYLWQIGSRTGLDDRMCDGVLFLGLTGPMVRMSGVNERTKRTHLPKWQSDFLEWGCDPARTNPTLPVWQSRAGCAHGNRRERTQRVLAPDETNPTSGLNVTATIRNDTGHAS